MMFADKSTPLFKSATLRSLGTIRIDRFVSFAGQQFKRSLKGHFPANFATEFLRACNLTQSQMQKIIDALVSDDRVLRDDTGLQIVDPLEELALIQG